MIYIEGPQLILVWQTLLSTRNTVSFIRRHPSANM